MLLGLDVGGTFTDAVIIDGHRVVATAKRRTRHVQRGAAYIAFEQTGA